jgi:hypothetical protein
MKRMRTSLVQPGQPGMVLLYDGIVGGLHATKANGVRIIIITFLPFLSNFFFGGLRGLEIL